MADVERHMRVVGFVVVLSLLIIGCQAANKRMYIPATGPTFDIDYVTGQFLKDGEPFRYVSGSIHYYRVLPDQWPDRLAKLRAAGFNAVETYVEWASHEPEPGVYDFAGRNDMQAFIEVAMQEGLLVILRLGPYIDAERDMGGLPYWLLRLNKNMILRSMDPSYLERVDSWLGTVLLPRIVPHLYQNGGPIIMIQVENEYGSYHTCDYAYTGHLRDLYRRVLGDAITLFSTDGSGVEYLKCGKVANVYATVDFGPGGDVASSFYPQKLFEPSGPSVNSEFYPGWLDHWGQPHAKTDTQVVTKTWDEILAYNASVNMYMFHGGTSFGFSSGSNLGGSFQACPTSYDYDAPLSEAGDPTEKYFAIRNVTSKYMKVPLGSVPPASPKFSYGNVTMASIGSLQTLASLLQSVVQPWPLTFEDLHMPNGIVMYQTSIPSIIPDPARLSLKDVHDRGYVFVDTAYVGLVSREQNMYDLAISAQPNQTLTVIVESQGRVCYGSGINDFKGLTANVTLNGFPLEGWTMTPMPLTNTTRLRSSLIRLQEEAVRKGGTKESRVGTPRGGMAFYEGQFQVPNDATHPRDTFLKLEGWHKGVAWVNDFCLGRYWPVMGPQLTLYVPKGVLKRGPNTILLLELESSPCSGPSASCIASLQDYAEIDGPTPRSVSATGRGWRDKGGLVHQDNLL